MTTFLEFLEKNSQSQIFNSFTLTVVVRCVCWETRCMNCLSASSDILSASWTLLKLLNCCLVCCSCFLVAAGLVIIAKLLSYYFTSIFKKQFFIAVLLSSLFSSLLLLPCLSSPYLAILVSAPSTIWAFSGFAAAKLLSLTSAC